MLEKIFKDIGDGWTLLRCGNWIAVANPSKRPQIRYFKHGLEGVRKVKEAAECVHPSGETIKICNLILKYYAKGTTKVHRKTRKD